MTSNNTLNFPSPDPAGVCHVTIDDDGDTFLTLDDPQTSILDPSPPPKKYIFRVSSEILSSKPQYFRALFSRPWKDRELREDKYYIRLQSLPGRALYLLLTSMHKPAELLFAEKSYKERRWSDEHEMPDTVPLKVLVDIILCVDYLDCDRKCHFSPLVVDRWFHKFCNEQGEWYLPDQYDEELMTWWCLSKYFEPQPLQSLWYVDPFKSLCYVTEKVIMNAPEAIQSFGLPVTRAQIDRLKQQREQHEWFRLTRINVEDERLKAEHESLLELIRLRIGGQIPRI
jgi:hypothetical protein